jgi:hypothetical protein
LLLDWGVPASVPSRPRSHKLSRMVVQIKTNATIHRQLLRRSHTAAFRAKIR